MNNPYADIQDAFRILLEIFCDLKLIPEWVCRRVSQNFFALWASSALSQSETPFTQKHKSVTLNEAQP